MSASPAATIGRELAALFGAEHVREDSQSLAACAIEGLLPAAVVSPGSPEEIAALLRLASERAWTVVPAGGGTQQSVGGVPERVEVVVRTDRLRAVHHYDPGDLTLGVDAGLTLAAVDRMLAGHGQILPLDVARPEAATIGGVLATAAHGPMRHAYGGVRDFCIGITFVTGDGAIAHGGGRVVKNVAGYDLMKLLIGSHGSLGVITGANFRVFTRPAATCTFECSFASVEEAKRFRDRVLSSPLTPRCLELLSPYAGDYLQAPPPAEPSPEETEMLPVDRGSEGWRILVRAAGSEAVLARYRRELKGGTTRELAGEEETRLWSAVSEFSETVMARHRNAMMVALSVPVASVASTLEAAERAALDNNFLLASVGRVGVGSMLLAFIPLLVDPPSAMQYVAAVSAFRGSLPRDASAIVARCPREAKLHFSVWGSSPTDLECMRAVKRALDPASILNRGRFMV
ncbi:MAG TPA: FAD-binding oxidoreductase [Terriglobales bacterium]|nr:FAD-binding oxidoreductase [Terriglobales bacterium]